MGDGHADGHGFKGYPRRAACPHQAFVTADALKIWLPPQGMSCEIQTFEPRAGGAYRMVLRYESLDHATPGRHPKIPMWCKGDLSN